MTYLVVTFKHGYEDGWKDAGRFYNAARRAYLFPTKAGWKVYLNADTDAEGMVAIGAIAGRLGIAPHRYEVR